MFAITSKYLGKKVFGRKLDKFSGASNFIKIWIRFRSFYRIHILRHSATIFFKDQKKFHKNTRKIMNFEQKVNFMGQMIYMQDLQLIET